MAGHITHFTDQLFPPSFSFFPSPMGSPNSPASSFNLLVKLKIAQGVACNRWQKLKTGVTFIYCTNKLKN